MTKALRVEAESHLDARRALNLLPLAVIARLSSSSISDSTSSDSSGSDSDLVVPHLRPPLPRTAEPAVSDEASAANANVVLQLLNHNLNVRIAMSNLYERQANLFMQRKFDWLRAVEPSAGLLSLHAMGGLTNLNMNDHNPLMPGTSAHQAASTQVASTVMPGQTVADWLRLTAQRKPGETLVMQQVAPPMMQQSLVPAQIPVVPQQAYLIPRQAYSQFQPAVSQQIVSQNVQQTATEQAAPRQTVAQETAVKYGPILVHRSQLPIVQQPIQYQTTMAPAFVTAPSSTDALAGLVRGLVEQEYLAPAKTAVAACQAALEGAASTASALYRK
eukprot:Blabericola_migrator_1__1162@NODE_129_length_13297_cov_112_007559_g114_i0_p4_GENE_NODE_129_length_13297_cov_112_007559_g114_i0NODE_129_length_13297_cov_112_007559_g114_i0_p4_ORF_typecomplete_len331_score55_46Carb_kinase/PF01256_17/0_028_NODE_129_length_13297_cov_112_007559_g114_i01129612288